MRRLQFLFLLMVLSLQALGQYSGAGPVRLTLTATATGIQWYKDGVALSGAISTTYDASIPATYHATYVDSTQGCTSIQSNYFVLAAAGTSVTLDGQANNSGGTNYRWTKESNPISGAASSTYTTTVGGVFTLTYNNGTCDVSTTPYVVFYLAANCLATIAPTLSASTQSNVCPASTVSLTLITASNTPANTTLTWHSGTPATTANKLSSVTSLAAGTYYAAFFDATNNCYGPTTAVTAQVNGCQVVFPPLPPVPTACDYSSAPANVTVNVTNEPAGYSKVYLLVDMANGQLVKTNPTAPSFTGVNAGNYYVVAAYYADSLKNATIGKKITQVYSTSGCLKYSTPLALKVCGSCDYFSSPTTITFPAAPSPTAGVTTSYVLIDEKTNQIRQISGTASFAGVDTGAYAVVAVYRSKPLNLAIGDVLYSKVTTLDSCYETSNAIHYRVCTACVAGTVAPVITATTATNSCPTATVNLMNLANTGTRPAGTTLVWSTKRVPTLATDTLTNATAINTAGKYYALYYSKTGNCFSPADSVTVTLTVCNCPAGTNAPVIATTSLTNACPTTTVSLAGLTNTGTKPSGTTLVWSTKKVPTSSADTLTSLTGISTGGKYYALYYSKAGNCFSPADSVNVYITDCESPLPPLPPPSPICDYSAPANITLTVATEPADFLKTYLLVDMANGKIVQVNATAPSFTNVGAGNYYAVAAYYKGTLEDATVGQIINNVSSSEGCLKYSTPLVFRVCGNCDYTTAPATITFTAAPSPTAGVTTTYVLIDEKTNTIKAINSSASFAAIDTGYYAVVAVYRTKPISFAVGNVLFTSVVNGDSCYTTSNAIHFRVCSGCIAGTVAPAITATTAANVCPATSVNLTTLTNTGTKPAGTSLVWSTKKTPTTGSDTLTNANAVTTSGKYYALYYDKGSNCFSPADSVTVTISACICPAGTVAPVIAASSLLNSCPATTVSLATLTNTGTKPAGTTLIWSTRKVPTSAGDTLTNLTRSTSGKVYAMYYHKGSNCYSPADSVEVQINDCESPIPPLPPVPVACDYSSAPANVVLNIANEPAGYQKTYVLVDMSNGKIVKINPASLSFTGVEAGNYYALAAYYADTLKNLTVGNRITQVYSTSGCLKYSNPYAFKVCGACDFTSAPATITFNTTPSTTPGVTTRYVLIDEKTNRIKAVSSTASFAAIDTGSYAVVAVYRTKPINLTVGDVLYSKVTAMDSCYEVSDALHYRVCSGNPPVATVDIYNTVKGKPVSGNVLVNDFDPDGGPLVVTTTPVTPPKKGQVILNANGTFTYTPDPNSIGEDSFCYEVTDNTGLKSTACVIINIIPPPTIENNKPIAADDATTTYKNTTVTIKVKANDVDPDAAGTPNGTLGNPTKLTNPSRGTVTLNNDGTFSYKPDSGFVGKDTFTYQICDNGNPSLCDTATVTITILQTPPPGNLPPIAGDDANNTLMNTSVSGTVATNDYDPDNNVPLTFTALSLPKKGTLTLNSNGTYTYKPDSSYVGSDVFTYKVCDNGTPSKCDTATVTLTILPPPVAKLLLKVLLQGALYATSDGLMRDDLRRLNLIPLQEPYTALNTTLGTTSTRFKHVKAGGETTTAAVLSANVGTANAIVDWVYVELRDKADSTKVLQTASGLVQRDGDIVSPTDGTSALTFTGLTSTSYFVAVKHRNHLGTMTSKAIPMTTVGTLVDFTVMDSSNVYNLPNISTLNYDGVEMNKSVLPGKKALWAGNAISDLKLKYDGATTDLTKPLNEILVDFSSTLYNFNNGIGYKQGDINMDGKVKYSGASNDIIYIQNNILLYRLNTGLLYNFNNMLEQIP